MPTLSISIEPDVDLFLEAQARRFGLNSSAEYIERLAREHFWQEKQRIRSLEPSGPGPYGEQDENGVDLSLIRENLKLSPLERIRKAEAASQEALRLMEYGRRSRPNSL